MLIDLIVPHVLFWVPTRLELILELQLIPGLTLLLLPLHDHHLVALSIS